ncbi:Dimethyladenosine transferase 1, mitochondrial [Halocaridina rubra]|uniref:rRNA adenine N(6)-methyltransferase n=1 Tax=Halocaridina rubra TaxID=373956 RepID=A0AAN8ZY09_HALRR
MAGAAAKHVKAASYLRLPPLPSTGDLLKLYRIRGRKQLSQNFLMDPKLTSKIVRSGGRVRDCHVCEVGPGPGSITRSILEQKAAFVTVIEKDPRFLPSLELLQDACSGRLRIELGDVLTYNMANSFPSDLRQPWDGNVPKIHIVGNLPFNISTPLIIRWLHDVSVQKNAWVFGRVPMTLTFQYEVAERIVALPGEEQRCRLSVMCQNWCHVKHSFTIPGRVFIPKPKVDVGIVNFVPRVEPLIPLDFSLVEKVLRCVFQFRQKYCKRGVAMLFPKNLRDELTHKMITVADVDPTIRPFKLTMREFNRLCLAYSTILKQKPSIAKYNGGKEFILESEELDEDDTNAEDETSQFFNMEKTKSELWDLLKALYEHGSNVDTLDMVLPGWTRSQIEHALKRYRHRAYRKLIADEKKSKDASLNLWAKVMENLHQIQGSTNHPCWRKGRKKLNEEPKDHAPILSKVMMYAACFEDHYSGNGADDPNYSEIYRYLSQLLEGQEPTQLSPGSANKILEMLSRIKKTIMDGSAHKYIVYLNHAKISYLPETSKMQTGNSSKRSLEKALNDQKELSLEPPCPLFEDEEDDNVILEPSDPYYELKKSNAIKKIKTTQQMQSAVVQQIPGLNPMEISAEYLTKPDCAILEQ